MHRVILNHDTLLFRMVNRDGETVARVEEVENAISEGRPVIRGFNYDQKRPNHRLQVAEIVIG
jgi:hypothetical protein